MLSGEVTNTNCIVFGLTLLVLYEHVNHNTSDAVGVARKKQIGTGHHEHCLHFGFHVHILGMYMYDVSLYGSKVQNN